MIWADYVLLGLIVLSSLFGLLRGLLREALGLLAWIAAFWLALRYAAAVAERLTAYIALPSARVMVGFTALFIAVLVAAAVLTYAITHLTSTAGLSGTDRLLGLVFGAARGIVLVAVLVMLAGMTPLASDPWWQRSVLIHYFQPVAEWLKVALPADLTGRLR